MAPIKFEEQLKDKLERRTLNPSSEAWDVLSDRLDKQERKNHNVRFWWLGIAASIVGVILVMTQFYKTESNVKDLPVIVNTEIVPDVETEPLNQPEEINVEVVTTIESNTELLKETKDTERIDTSNLTSITIQEPIKVKDVIEKPLISEDVMVSVKSNNTKTNEVIPIVTPTQEELKIMEVVDIIKNLDTGLSSVSDREIDSLLKQAQRELINQRIINESTKTVSADALLQDVEVELEQSFRAKVFEALKSSYKSVKTAVAERRN